MQKLKLTPVANAKKLNRNELKNIFGGFGSDGDFGSSGIGFDDSDDSKYNGWRCCDKGWNCDYCYKTKPTCISPKRAVQCYVHDLL